MPNPDRKPTEADAIRQVIADGVRGDYADISAAVQQRFGLIVGSRLVEEVVQGLRSPAAEHQPAAGGQRDTGRTPPASDQRHRVLEFVQEMGGFAEARAAIDELESAVKRLMR
jgi:hypothetical protein